MDNSKTGNAVNDAVDRTVRRAVNDAVCDAAHWAVDLAGGRAVYRAVYWAVRRPGSQAVAEAVNWALWDDPALPAPPALQNFLRSSGADGAEGIEV